jgi:hypothetical protein
MARCIPSDAAMQVPQACAGKGTANGTILRPETLP